MRAVVLILSLLCVVNSFATNFCEGENPKCSYVYDGVHCGYDCKYIYDKVYCADSSRAICSYVYDGVHCGIDCKYIYDGVYCADSGKASRANPAKVN